ncbi:TolC family protein [Niabella yanshanensis]|uniref:TolC family protein n=1 Tax=Niabella yanshanensis TaxID=577386 RepID=A0ABZ0WB05_9BACT|nr:TolC family protein [Niabella yanshanensis]WQD39657.1 TolC family protein [Niabella yanshanensis]
MKAIFFLLFLCTGYSFAFSQESIIEDIDDKTLDKYITLARQHFPAKKAADARLERAQIAVNIAKLTWLDIFNIGYYYQPQRSRSNADNGGVGINTQGQIITQGFLTGVTVNIGNLFSKPGLVKTAKAEYTIAKAEREQYDATLNNEVKSRYYDFLLARRTLEIRSLASQNYKGIMSDVKAKYERSEIGIDVYTESRNAATQADALALAAEVAFLKSKNLLEEIIGKKLEDVK